MSMFDRDFLAHLRSLGYEGVRQETDYIVGMAIFYKTTKFKLEWTESRSRAMMVGLTMEVSVEVGEGAEATMSPLSVMVCTVHLEGKADETAKRFTQVKSLLKRCEARLPKGVKPQEAMVFICGDFNSSEDGGAVRLLEDGELGPEFREYDIQVTPTHFRHPFRFVNAYPIDQRYLTFITSFSISTIDHIFSPLGLVDTVGVLSFTPGELEEMKQTMLPNVTHSSDHLPVGAVFQLNSRLMELLRGKVLR